MEGRKNRKGRSKGNSTTTTTTSTTSRATNTTNTSNLSGANSNSNVSTASATVTNSKEKIKPSSLSRETAEWAERIKNFGWADIAKTEAGKKMDGIQMMLSIVQHARKMLDDMEVSSSKQNADASDDDKPSTKISAEVKPKQRTEATKSQSREAGPSWKECKSCGIPIQKSCSAPSQRDFGIQVQQDRIAAATEPKRAVAGQPRARKTLPRRRLETPKFEEPKRYYTIESPPTDQPFYVGWLPSTDTYCGLGKDYGEALRPDDQLVQAQLFQKPPCPALPLHLDHECPFRISLYQDMVMRYVHLPDEPYYHVSPERPSKPPRKRQSRSQTKKHQQQQQKPPEKPARRIRPRSFPRASYFAIWPQIMLRKSSSWPELCLRKLFYDADEWLFT